MIEKVLGKIEKVKLGAGGYDDAMFGVSFTISLRGGSSCVGDFWGGFRDTTGAGTYQHLAYRLDNLMKEAKVSDFNKLVGVPVEVTLDNGRMTEWRVLSEVL